MNAYQLLGVHEGASVSEVHQAYISKIQVIRELTVLRSGALRDLKMAYDLLKNSDDLRDLALRIRFQEIEA